MTWSCALGFASALEEMSRETSSKLENAQLDVGHSVDDSVHGGGHGD